ncbi:ammonia-forming cytochrome c nitrite reductase subunit c552 [Myxococcus sp. MISCRS1]|jgi:nitrite reductase (cytochrome c-552)|uniref:ammonia-forming cytochrome c nitrite reductase subunit c552 n=1 Tax=unclassified Myxococcus TaxID=2648731 RepID=UPI001CBF8BDC|nr:MULTISPECIES: ammonia-forming cytochrome c nitrite reductase subunit c552 [unclassified Myxococcus]MBZ4394088.1 ammonia-forming cytochrome c nitrite reductase subunit c552 [Myxococcus sp. AS-1-15]MCY1001057.1 ammonia-forming cytochrome c nitrite reductase subunit c552 [Myxococcus sp. MISCRS1]BDT37383.1 ammonia-forming cytochrome c nitrite reductase subunit c552 [Myxococcus sp. MH1]
MTEPQKAPGKRRWLSGVRLVVAVAVAAALASAGVTALLVNIMERKQEARNPFYRVVELDDTITDPAVWGKNFPLQYDSYKRTVDQQRTRYGGSEAVARTPTKADPRSVVAQSRLEEDPRLVTMWSGYAFATDFREERGHAHMLEDQVFTERQHVTAQPGTCIHCHGSVYVPYKKLGDGDLIKGFEKMNQLPFAEARKLVDHPVSCIDCHDPTTMQLRVTRPGFIEGIAALKASQGVPDFKVNEHATRQEMRTYVCGQCHVEYYFKGKQKRLTYPWAKGIHIEQIMAYYDEDGHTDWTHKLTGAKVLKAQHPEFEMYNQGIHARSGVACADCHMPYQREGAMKVSDHHVRSPLLNINRACQTCHKWSEAELLSRAEAIQTRTFETRNIAMDALVDLIHDLQNAQKAGVSDEALAKARDYQKRAQFYLDFVEAENSMGFHADQEAVRILGNSINFSRLGQNALRPEGGASTSPDTRPQGAPKPVPAAAEGTQQGSR